MACKWGLPPLMTALGDIHSPILSMDHVDALAMGLNVRNIDSGILVDVLLSSSTLYETGVELEAGRMICTHVVCGAPYNDEL